MSRVMTGLPPDLARLGQELNASVERAVRRRARLELARRVVPAALVGAMTVVAVTPGMLGPSQRQPGAVATPSPVADGSIAPALGGNDPRVAILATTTDAAWLEAEEPFQPAVGQ